MSLSTKLHAEYCTQIGSVELMRRGGDGAKNWNVVFCQGDSVRRFWERIYPCVAGIAAAAIYLTVPKLRDYVFPDTLPNLLSALVSVGGIAVGFLATAKSIMISVDDRPIVKRMKEVKIYQRVMSYLRAAIRWSFMLAVMSAVAL